MTNYFVALVFLIMYICDITCGQYLEEQALITHTRCLLDSDCQTISTNSFCFNNDAGRTGICKCTDGYELMSRNRTFFACLKHAGYGEPCEKNIQCQIPLSVNAICNPNDNTCKCADHAHLYTDGKCYTSVLLEDFCINDGSCYLSDGTFGNCIAGRCSCKFDLQVPAQDKMSCIEIKRIGELCQSDEQCSWTSNAICRMDCRCAAGYTLARNRSSCLKAATRFYDSCSEDVQCTEYLPGSYCNEYRCTCAQGQHGYGSRCVRTAAIGGVCTAMEECSPEPSLSQSINCVEGVCQCFNGFINKTLGCNSSNRNYVMPFIVSVVLIAGFLAKSIF